MQYINCCLPTVSFRLYHTKKQITGSTNKTSNLPSILIQQTFGDQALHFIYNIASHTFFVSFIIHQWDASLFSGGLRGYWDDISNQRSLIDELTKKFNITDSEGWFKITAAMITKHGGATLLSKYNGSVSVLLSTICPEYLKACREKVMRLASELKLTNLEDIAKLPQKYPS